MRLNTITARLRAYIIGLSLLLPQLMVAQQSAPPSSDKVPPEVVKYLLGIAEEAITAQNEILVSGDAAGSLKAKAHVPQYRAAMQKQFDNQVARRNILKSKKQDYKAFESKFTPGDVWNDGSKVFLVLTEQTKLRLDVPGGPDSTEYSQDYVFEFNNSLGSLTVNDQWSISKLSEVAIGNPTPTQKSYMAPKPSGDQPVPAGAMPLEHPTMHAPPGYRPVSSLRRRGASVGSPMFIKASYVQSGTYNASTAVSYAKRFALYPNPEYGVFDNDCTNFVSQCMSAGGWPQVGWNDRANPSYWYYWCTPPFTYRPIASYSWAAAWNFNQFILGANRVFHEDYFENMIPGDLLFADWNNIDSSQLSPDGRVDHAMIVTSKDANNQIYLSYHSTNTKDISLTDLQARAQQQGRTANYFGDGMRTSF